MFKGVVSAGNAIDVMLTDDHDDNSSLFVDVLLPLAIKLHPNYTGYQNEAAVQPNNDQQKLTHTRNRLHIMRNIVKSNSASHSNGSIS